MKDAYDLTLEEIRKTLAEAEAFLAYNDLRLKRIHAFIEADKKAHP